MEGHSVIVSDLRPRQILADKLIRQSLSTGHRRPCVQAPTGFGKTKLAANIAAGVRQKHNRLIFVVPAISLVNQTVEEFYREGIREVGVIQADHPLTNYAMPVQVASVQTLQNRQIPHADVVVIDECHIVYKLYARWMEEWNNTPFVGLSATPWTKGLGKLYDDLLIAGTTQELINEDFLCDFVVMGPKGPRPDVAKCKTRNGDWVEKDLSAASNQRHIRAPIVENWLANGEGRPTFCFAVDRAHARDIQRDFLEAGVNCGYIDAYTKDDERKEIKRKFHAGEMQVVTSVGCLTTGIDWDVRCIILARDTKDEKLYVQMIGRGLRKAPGKDYLLIFDHTTTTERLGYVTDIHHEKLCDGKLKKKSTSAEREKPMPKRCQADGCGYIKPAGVHACPACGFAPQKQTNVVTVEGELVELKRKKKTNRELSPEEKAKFFGELKGYADQCNYKPGWAAHAYREKFGVWPNAHKNAPILEPSATTLGFIKHLQIKKAKSQQGRKYA